MHFDKLNQDLWLAIRRQVFVFIDSMAEDDAEHDESEPDVWCKLVVTRHGDIEDVLGFRRGGWTISGGEVVVWVSFIDGIDDLKFVPTNRALGQQVED